jgi:hypothetical protein
VREQGGAAKFYVAGMAVVLVGMWLGGDNGVVYTVSLLGVPVVSGVLAGLGLIRFWHAVLGCLAVVALDVVFDETRAEDAVFFAVLALVMVGIAALARLVTRWVVRRRSDERPASPDSRGRSTGGVSG